MKHLIQRGGREYGPYSIEEIRGYVDQGNVVTSDLSKVETSASWTPVSAMLTVPAPAGGNPRTAGARRGCILMEKILDEHQSDFASRRRLVAQFAEKGNRCSRGRRVSKTGVVHQRRWNP